MARWSLPSTPSSAVISQASPLNVSRSSPLPTTSLPITAMATPSITSLKMDSVRIFIFVLFSRFYFILFFIKRDLRCGSSWFLVGLTFSFFNLEWSTDSFIFWIDYLMIQIWISISDPFCCLVMIWLLLIAWLLLLRVGSGLSFDFVFVCICFHFWVFCYVLFGLRENGGIWTFDWKEIMRWILFLQAFYVDFHDFHSFYLCIYPYYLCWFICLWWNE